jgi:hypothetical protein
MPETDGPEAHPKGSALAQQQRPQRRTPYASNEKARYQGRQIETQTEEHHGSEKESAGEKNHQKEVTPDQLGHQGTLPMALANQAGLAAGPSRG